MNFPLARMYRLAPRGGDGLACDKAGVALGAADLVRVGADAAGRRRCEVRPRQGLGRILSAAYGPQPQDVILGLHRGLSRAAKAIEADDLCLAGIEAVLLRLPELTRQALAKLAEVAELEKGGTAWQNEPRVPAGQPDGGQWTTAEGASGAPTVRAKPAAVLPYVPAPAQSLRSRSTTASIGPGSTTRTSSWLAARRKKRSRAGRTGRRTITRRLEDVFPGLREAPGLAIPLAPIDGFLGLTALADEADAEFVWGQYWGLIHQIKQVDPTFKDEELFPPGKIDGLTRQGRTNLINHLLMERAAAYYRVRGDVGFLKSRRCGFYKTPSTPPTRKPSRPPTPAVFSHDCRERRRSATKLTLEFERPSGNCSMSMVSLMVRART